MSILFHSGYTVEPNTPINFSAPFEPYYWVTPSGAEVDRTKLMVVLNNLQGIYIRSNYGLDRAAQARLIKLAIITSNN